MPVAMKTPGVYIVEKNAFPNSVVEVATAVPAFIGYTAKADNKGIPLTNKPFRISSMAVFEKVFGGDPTQNPPASGIAPATFDLVAAADPAHTAFSVTNSSGVKKSYAVNRKETPAKQYLLYYSMLLFYQNGGGPCYIVSVGDYTQDISKDALLVGIQALLKEQEPTMVVIPDAVRLGKDDCYSVQQQALQHCGTDMKNRVAIFDIYNGFQEPSGDPDPNVGAFRDGIGKDTLSFGTAYYPWLNTTIVSDSDLSYKTNISSGLKDVLTAEGVIVDDPAAPTHPYKDVLDALDSTTVPPSAKFTSELLHKTLTALSPAYVAALTEIKRQLNTLPPSPAIAGVYTKVDAASGVWKAPANVSLNSVVSPTATVSALTQENLNVDIQGKSINVIRSFIGEGVLVWGARTLDGNSLDWRYVGVRRTMIFLEESVRLATKAYVFENNVSSTWVTVKSMIRNFLTGVWKRGGLAGSTPDDAFAVFCGLGETMTSEDILEGIMRVTVLVAVTRPAEFIEITFQQQMQKS
jgi:phage tail sheath protein FI